MVDRISIEGKARELQREILDKSKLLCPKFNGDLLSLIKPRYLAQVLDIDFREVSGLTEQIFSFRGRKFKVGGLMDRQRRLIAVASDVSLEVQRFTAFHEFGHLELHPGEVMHRDMPLNGTPNSVRPPLEREADYFAAVFLMPRKSVRKQFKARFREEQLTFHNTNAQLICPEHAHELLRADERSLDREKAIARCRNFGGDHFPSLAGTFGVSVTAMAIRLKELGLVVWP